jgi:hypothetical protein
MKTLSSLVAAAALVFASTAAYAQNGPHGGPAPHVNVPPHAPQQPVRPAPAPAAPKAAKAAAPKPAAAPAVHVHQTQQIAQRWASEHGLPVRTVEVGPPERRVTRMFVPVTKKNWQSFHDLFAGPDKPSMMLVLQSGDSHMTANIGGEEFLWARPNPHTHLYGKNQFHGDGEGAMDGKGVVINLTPEQYQHAQTWFQHRKDPNDEHFSYQCGAACMDYIGNIEVEPGKDGTNQLRAIPEAEVLGAGKVQRAGGNYQGQKNLTGSVALPVGRRLFDMLGIARSKDGRNMGYNLVHAANDNVQVIAVPVGDQPSKEPKVIRENGRVFVRYVPVGGGVDPIEHFKTMPEAELLGPLPPQGIAGVVRPVK